MSYHDQPPPSFHSLAPSRGGPSNGYTHPSADHHASHRGMTYWKPSTTGPDTSHDRTPVIEPSGATSAGRGTGAGGSGTKLVLRLGGSGGAAGAGPSSGMAGRVIDGDSGTPSRGSTPGEFPRTARVKETSGRHRASPPLPDMYYPGTPSGAVGGRWAQAPRTATLDDDFGYLESEDGRGRGRKSGGTGGSGSRNGDADALISDANEGLANRLLRSRRPVEETPVVMAGVSASGKGVKVSGAAKVGGGAVKKRKAADVPNQDFCSACRGIGRFLCCDGCPRSFHFMCLEPPLRVDELPEEEIWYCKQCKAERAKESPHSIEDGEKDKDKEKDKAIPTIFKELNKRIEVTNPHQFRLPPEVRNFFAGVGESTKGEYMDTEEARTRYDRKGFQEERDPIRLRDGKARPVSCYICAGTSLPSRSLTTDPGGAWRQIVSCDYCALHFHLDCLNPPLATMPNSSRKWMCPNHVEQVMPRRRTLRSGVQTVDVEATGTPNNGNIIVMPDEPVVPRLEYEDTVINRRKYRVPERVIHLDFWAKLASRKGKRPSSDLIPDASEEDLEAANLVLSFFSSTGAGSGNAPGQHGERVKEETAENGGVGAEGPMEVDGDEGAATTGKTAAAPRITLRMPRAAH